VLFIVVFLASFYQSVTFIVILLLFCCYFVPISVCFNDSLLLCLFLIRIIFIVVFFVFISYSFLFQMATCYCRSSLFLRATAAAVSFHVLLPQQSLSTCYCHSSLFPRATAAAVSFHVLLPQQPLVMGLRSFQHIPIH
jgi:hypothetical protein